MCVSCLVCLAPAFGETNSFCSVYCLNSYIALAPIECVDAYWDGQEERKRAWDRDEERAGYIVDVVVEPIRQPPWDITDLACQNCGLTYCGGDCYNLAYDDDESIYLNE